MGHLLSTPAAQLHRTTPDPLRTPRLRTALPPHGRPDAGRSPRRRPRTPARDGRARGAGRAARRDRWYRPPRQVTGSPPGGLRDTGDRAGPPVTSAGTVRSTV